MEPLFASITFGNILLVVVVVIVALLVVGTLEDKFNLVSVLFSLPGRRNVHRAIAQLPENGAALGILGLLKSPRFLDQLDASTYNYEVNTLKTLAKRICKDNTPDAIRTMADFVKGGLPGGERISLSGLFDRHFIGTMIDCIAGLDDPRYDDFLIMILTAEYPRANSLYHECRDFAFDEKLIEQRLNRLSIDRSWPQTLTLGLRCTPHRIYPRFQLIAVDLFKRVNAMKSEEWTALSGMLSRNVSHPSEQVNLGFVYDLTQLCAEIKEPRVLPVLATLGRLNGWSFVDGDGYGATLGCTVTSRAHFERLPFCMAVYFHVAASLGLFDLILEHLSDSPFSAQAREVLEPICHDSRPLHCSDISDVGRCWVSNHINLSLGSLKLNVHPWYKEINQALGN